MGSGSIGGMREYPIPHYGRGARYADTRPVDYTRRIVFVTGGGIHMLNLQKGFGIGDQFVPWGATLEEACRQLGIQPGHGCHRAEEVRLLCASAYGFAAVNVHLEAPATDRPVTSVDFELAPAGTGTPEPEIWAAPLSERLGPPDQVSRSEIPSYADPADCVPFYARWVRPETSVGLSIYGGLRKVDGGQSAGTLWLSWNEQLAAQPYIEEWRAPVARLTAMAERPSQLRTFVLDWPQNAYWLTGDATPQALAARQARISLYQPTLLDTPANIAAKLNPHSFALWSSESNGIWCASTLRDSVMFELGQPVQATWVDLQPAKGPGYAMLQLGVWSVYGRHGSRAIRDAAQMLAGFPGVTVKQEGGYDC
ncbi:hypothetical protein ACR2R6_00820 [Methylocaldum gracile subsp. desertum]|uniref:hypothetical protein n=1 Tax=Methylocaldum sp. GT1BW TaxID=3438964 RepID=UPI003DA15D61